MLTIFTAEEIAIGFAVVFVLLIISILVNIHIKFREHEMVIRNGAKSLGFPGVLSWLSLRTKLKHSPYIICREYVLTHLDDHNILVRQLLRAYICARNILGGGL